MDPRPPQPRDALDAALHARLHALMDEGWEHWARFDREVRSAGFHPFVPADYERVLAALLPLRAPGVRFLELGSGNGVIAIMADLLGFDACGIELDAALVDAARELARRFDSGARFYAGSFLPSGYRWRPRDGDGRTATIGDGDSAYPAMGRALDDFDLVYAYPWGGEEPMLRDLVRQYGRRDGRLLLNGDDGVTITRIER